MTKVIDSLASIADQFDAIVLDQWGVLHDGTAPYPHAIECLNTLHARETRLAVLSNSGKRAALNAARIAKKGFDPALFDIVMTSGEALWRDVKSGDVTGSRVFAITAQHADATAWAKGLNLTFVDDMDNADWVLLMGLPDFGNDDAAAALWFQRTKARILQSALSVYCSNPDRTSPRAGGALVVSPGALAHEIADAGGSVAFYGKPYRPVFRALETALNAQPERLLMVGDSLEHDIAGGMSAGWKTAFVRGGIHAQAFQSDDVCTDLDGLIARKSTVRPDFTLSLLR